MSAPSFFSNLAVFNVIQHEGKTKKQEITPFSS